MITTINDVNYDIPSGKDTTNYLWKISIVTGKPFVSMAIQWLGGNQETRGIHIPLISSIQWGGSYWNYLEFPNHLLIQYIDGPFSTATPVSFMKGKGMSWI